MVPDKFNMVDMGGIDLIMMQGEEVPGLYNSLVESIAQCRYQCLYNWFFDGVVIPPSYVEMEVGENEEIILNDGITVTPDDIIHIYSIEPSPADPEIIPLLAEENGIYNVPIGKDGFNPVTVDVPSYTPVIDPISIIENGTYTAPSGVDGFSPISVNVPSSIPFEEVYIENLTGGFVSGSTWYKDSGAGLYSDIYQVEANKHYIAMVSSVPGNRFRCLFTTQDVSTATSYVSGTRVGTEQDDPEPYSSKIAFKPPSNGYINVFKTNTGQSSAKTYLLCVEKLF